MYYFSSSSLFIFFMYLLLLLLMILLLVFSMVRIAVLNFISFCDIFSDGPEAVYLNQRSPMKGEEGDNVLVSCDAKCVPSCSYRWRFKYRSQSMLI